MQTNIRSLLFTGITLLFFAITVPAAAPPIEYKIHINPADISGLNVEMRVPAAGANARIAMAVHPEYDDRYWRYIEGFSAIEPSGRTLQFAKEEDTVWRIENARGDIVVRYRLRL